MRGWASLALWLLACNAAVQVHAAGTSLGSKANPIRKVVDMLQMMQEKVKEEGEKKKDLYDKFMCYCSTGGDSLKKAIADANDRIPQLESSVKESTAMHQQLTEQLKQHQQDRADATTAVEMATSLRKKDAAAFAKESGDLKANINALGQAIKTLSKGTGASFLQTSSASLLRRLSLTLDMQPSDRDTLSAFLALGDGGGDASDYEPKSGEILGIIKQMQEEMEKDLAELVKDEEGKIANHESLLAAKKKEIGAATKAIEQKEGRVGELAVSIATLKDDLEDTMEGFRENSHFLADLSRSCKLKQQDWVEYQKTQTEELVALAETIRLLNDDSALDLFKETLPSPSSFQQVSFLQTKATNMHKLKKQAHMVLKRVRGDPRVALLSMALQGQKDGFKDVLAKIDTLTNVLKEEQKGDDKHRAFCQRELSKAEEEKQSTDRSIADVKTVIANTNDALSEVNRVIQGLMAGIKDLDKQVAKATETRKAEHAASVDALAANNAAKQLLEMAKKRLLKFYNPALAKGPAALQMMERWGHLAKSQKALLLQHQDEQTDEGLDSNTPPPAPNADLSYVKKTEESGGVIAMLDLLREDLNRQITEMEMEEKQAQHDYEVFMKDSANKRTVDSKAAADKEGQKAELESYLHKDKEKRKALEKDLETTMQELSALHGQCDWLLQNFDLRKQARADEIESLGKAKAVLSGANYS